MTYEELEKGYEEDFSKMSITPEGVRYLKIRTLIDIETLKASEFLRNTFNIKISEIKRPFIEKLRKEIFLDQNISDEKLNEFLKIVYKELKVFRSINFESLKYSLLKISNEGDEYWNAWKSVYRDDIRQHIQRHFVRTERIQSYEELLKKIEKELDPVVKGYTIISWFNQWSSAIIEQFILSHPKVIPTARRIDKVDFFFLDIPIDLKITFVPEEYITLSIEENIITKPEQIVDEIKNNPQRLIKWLYENQGEQRFSDSHRLFVMLADAENLDRSWKLKASFDLIQTAIDKFLHSRNSKNDIPYINWEFRGTKIRGSWKTYSDLIFIIN
ncbi:MAG: hypothetical protein QW228_09885 [Candidatus Aenigmatarchaeota archaeon]